MESACDFLQHLDTTPPDARTHCERCFYDTEGLYQDLSDFKNQPGPVTFVLWRCNGRWARLFCFLAPRFLASPDHVLDCERQHARWQWLLQARHAMKLKVMIRLLRLRIDLENYDYFPPDDTLTPLLEHAALERNLALRRIQAEDVLAPGLREDALYRARFNLTHEDLVVIGGEGARSSSYTFATSWSTYLRGTCKPKHVHCFLGILPR